MIIDLQNKYYTYHKLIADAKCLAEKYASILENVTIGRSHDNRDILLLKLGIGKKYIICCSGVHARETINPIVLMRIIEYYADIYVNHRQERIDFIHKLEKGKLNLSDEYEHMLYGTCIYELLQTFTILFVPLVNPDGYMIATEGFRSIQNQELRKYCLTLEVPNREWKYNSRGVDLNRNFPSKLWRPKNEEDCAASENETRTLIELFHTYKANGFIDFHSRGKQIFYYRSMMPEGYNTRQLKIAERLKQLTDYVLMPPEEEVTGTDSGGNTVHYFSENFNKPALTIETVDEEAEFPLDINHRITTFEELKHVISEFGSMII